MDDTKRVEEKIDNLARMTAKGFERVDKRFDEMATKEQLQAVNRELKADLVEVRQELKSDIRDVRTIVLETDTKVDGFDKEMRDVTERVTLLEETVFPAPQE